jgi:hypothetical protein
MDLNFTPAEEAFRAEARAWLEANVPVGLPSGDTAATSTPSRALRAATASSTRSGWGMTITLEMFMCWLPSQSKNTQEPERFRGRHARAIDVRSS